MVYIDGSLGEGGGQILRTSIGLSLFTQREFKIVNIRGNRSKPGLLRQHLTAIEAAREISNAEVIGAEMRSRELIFKPGKINHGNYQFAVGTAGSCTLVLQAILPGLLTGSGHSDILFSGGTHNPFAPPFDFLDEVFFKVLTCMGAEIKAELVSYGFYPAGGGSFKIRIKAVPGLKKIQLKSRGNLFAKSGQCLVAKIPFKIAEDEAEIIAKKLNFSQEAIKPLEVKSQGPGNIIMLKYSYQNIDTILTGFGQKGVPLKKVAMDVVRQANAFQKHEIVVDRYLADQLLIPMAIAQGGFFLTGKPSDHTLTNARVIEQFLNIRVKVDAIKNHLYQISVKRS